MENLFPFGILCHGVEKQIFPKLHIHNFFEFQKATEQTLKTFLRGNRVKLVFNGLSFISAETDHDLHSIFS